MASEIRVDTSKNASGLCTVTYSNTGAVLSGITTGTFSGDITGDITGAVTATTGSFSGDISIADKIIHTGDTNTAIRFPSNDTFAVETGGSERVRIDSSGSLLFNQTQNKILVNTSDGSDSSWLNINGGGDASQSRGAGLALYGNENSGSEGKLWLLAGNSGSANGEVIMRTAGVDRLWVTSTGLVTQKGTWTNTYTGAATTQCGYQAQNLSDTTGTYAALRLTAGSSSPATAQIASVRTGTGQNDLTIQLELSNTAFEALRITSAGKVGINQTTPEEILDLGESNKQNLKFGQRGYLGQAHSTTATILGHCVKADTTNSVASQMMVTETNSGGGAPAAIRLVSGTIQFHTAGSGTANAVFDSEKLRITSTGQLQATGAADVRLTLGSSGTAGTNDSVHIRADSADLKFMAASGGTTLFESNGNEIFRITSGGNLGVNCGSPTSLTNSRGITLQGSGGTAAGFINFMDSADNSDGRVLADDGQLYIHADISDNTADSLITFNVDNSEKARIRHNGNFTVQRYTCASENTSGDFKITVSGLTNNGGNNWRKCGVFVIYNGINPDATNSRSAVGYYGVGSVTTWNWLGEDEEFTSDPLSCTLDDAQTTSFRLNFNVADQNTGSVTVFVNAWNVRPIVSIAG